MSALKDITDEQGFLQDSHLWNKEVAQQLAAQNGIHLTEAHWEIIFAVRKFYAEFDLSPPMRPLCKFLRQNLGADKATSLYLLGLFPDSPAKLAAKIAGLPKPDNCL